MKIIALIEGLIKIAPRIIKGVKDVKHLKNALKKNKHDDTDTPKGQVDYVRYISTATTVATLIAGVLWALGKLPDETYTKLLEVLSSVGNE